MKFTTTALFAFIAALTTAAPAPASQDYNGFQVVVTFQGAAGAQYTEFVPADGSVYYLNNALSISHIQSDGGATCTFYGVDGSQTTVVGAQTVDVGPPQTQTSGSCLAF
ncbi:hypothetical protein L207DRAFT_608739 [Hyaloscypha variabilis F]|uniref:Uncharacterized protein n=1 Tax=Hyaloscypha variabilis (strain UAMH 11265 / GT02V1 / F) TaxID=1149755 RepID=A0A2J6R390_HYAVF|nr:hypothetical protein L207DRAFT_608739 [Hyaloscypha variabilis F]